MRILTKAITYIALGLACLISASCQKDNTILYYSTTMGNVVDGRFVSDEGNVFNVVEQSCQGQLDTMHRAIVLCDILNKTVGGAENEYDIRLHGIGYVLTKEIVPSSTLTEADAAKLVEDPIRLEQAWISGGYLNVYIMFPVKIGSTTAHMINLVEVEDDNAEEYAFSLRHTASGETLTEENAALYQLGGAYVSFPLSSYIKEDSAKIAITYKWHKEVGNGLSTETEYKTINGEYVREGHDNVPKTINVLNSRKVLQF